MKNMKRLLIIGLLLLTAACGRHRHDDKQIFRYNESSGIATLDPAFAKDQSVIWPCRQLYNGLVELSTVDEGAEGAQQEAMQVQPSVAKSWTVSADGLTYTFTLRDDVFFHKSPLFGTADSTRRVVAEDFVYSFGRITDPSVASPGAWVLASVAGTEAPDDSTFIVRLKEPFAPFLSLLGMVYCSVVPHEVVEHYGKDFRNHPCGTGPFQFQYWKEGVKLVMRKNPAYFESGLPYLDAVAVTFIVDRQTVFLEFVKGNLDFMNSLDASYKDELLTSEGTLEEKYAGRINMTSTPYLNTEYLGFNMKGDDTPLKDSRIRQAINCGFDRRKMMRYLRNNIGTPGEGGFIPVGLPGAAAEPFYSYDPERAKSTSASTYSSSSASWASTYRSTSTRRQPFASRLRKARRRGSAARGWPTIPTPRTTSRSSTAPTTRLRVPTTRASPTVRSTVYTSKRAAAPTQAAAMLFTAAWTLSSCSRLRWWCSTTTRYSTSPTRTSSACAPTP